MKLILRYVIVVLSAVALQHGAVSTQAASGPAVLDEWGSRFISLGASVAENPLRTQIRTTIAQLAMFDAVNAVLDGPYRPFASKPPTAVGASPEAAAIRAAYVVARNEFPTKTATIDSAYAASIAGVLATNEAIAAGIVVGEAAANAALVARSGDHRNDPDLVGYTPGSGPGVWIPTPPAFANPQTPFLQFVRPFGYDDPARFRPHGQGRPRLQFLRRRAQAVVRRLSLDTSTGAAIRSARVESACGGTESRDHRAPHRSGRGPAGF